MNVANVADYDVSPLGRLQFVSGPLKLIIRFGDVSDVDFLGSVGLGLLNFFLSMHEMPTVSSI